MACIDRIREANTHRLGDYLPFGVLEDGVPVRLGHVRRDRAKARPRLFEGFLTEVGGLATIPARSLQPWLNAAVARLPLEHEISHPTGESYPVWPRVGAKVYGTIDRSAVAWFGVAATGVHVNGFVRDGDRLKLWIARRSRTKPTFPGELDNFVAGGQPVGLSLFENVVKECGEEAGVPEELAAMARQVGEVSYVYENETGLKPDTMVCYDLELPLGFKPVPVDGEVESFELMDAEDVLQITADTTEFKFNCALVQIDFFLRHGVISPGDPDHDALVASLHRHLPG